MGDQVEVCELCSRLVTSNELYVADVDGLRGRRICVYHGDLGTRPSWLDLRGIDTTLIDMVNSSIREPPLGDEVWWDADGVGYLLEEDGGRYVYQEDGLTGIRLEAQVS